MPRRTAPFVGSLVDWDTADGYVRLRVSHCQPDQVLDLAYAYDPQPCNEGLVVLEHGWFRTSPCPPNICGEHRYHLGRSVEQARGAFYAWLVGTRWVR